MADLLNDEIVYEEDTQKGKYLIFSLGQEDYGIEISYVTEIIGIQTITEIPDLPDYVKGIINLRGKIIPIMDIRLRFNKPPREYDDRTCIIVVDIKDLSIGLVVDSVSEVSSIADPDIATPPQINRGMQKYIKGIGKSGSDVKLLLDCARLLHGDELESLTEINITEP